MWELVVWVTEDEQGPHGLLRHGLCMCNMSVAVTKQFLTLLMIRLAV